MSMLEPLPALDWLGRTFTTTNQRIAVTAIAVAALLIVLLTSPRLQRWIDERTRTLYADVTVATVLVGACVFTVSVTIGVWGLTEEVGNLLSRYDLGGPVIARAAVSFVLLVTAAIVSRFVRRLLRDVLDPATSVTDHHQEVSTRMTQVVIWSLTLVVVLGIWVEDLGGLIVGAGFMGIVLGMAARQTLGSILSGFVLMFSRPFEIGDWIVVEEDHGVVTDISIVDTRIQSPDGEYVVIPNDVIGASAVTNRSRKGRLRVEVEVGVDYEADVDRAAELAETAVEDLDASLSVPNPAVVTKSFGDSAVVLGVWFWIENPSARRMWDARTDAIGAVKRAFEAEGVKIPYPQRELTGRESTDGFRIARDHLAYDEDDVEGVTDGSRDADEAGDDDDHDEDSETGEPDAEQGDAETNAEQRGDAGDALSGEDGDDAETASVAEASDDGSDGSGADSSEEAADSRASRSDGPVRDG